VKPRMTRVTARLHGLALGARLPDALGRALAATNRHYNDGGRGDDEGEVAYMRSVRPETARRWREHWLAGGSLKSLERTRAEESLRRSGSSGWPPCIGDRTSHAARMYARRQPGFEDMTPEERELCAVAWDKAHDCTCKVGFFGRANCLAHARKR